MNRRRSFNTKRRLAPLQGTGSPSPVWATCTYGGNPEHKSRAGDYGLSPPVSPRPAKTLCDAHRALPKAEATALLRAGFERGMVSERRAGAWPQNVWAVDDYGEAFEAQLENREIGTYHGYPMPDDDPFKVVIVREWHGRAS